VHEDCPEAEYDPAEQIKHALDDVWATSGWYVPALHEEQEDKPVEAPYFPLTQLTHEAADDWPVKAFALPKAHNEHTEAPAAE